MLAQGSDTVSFSAAKPKFVVPRPSLKTEVFAQGVLLRISMVESALKGQLERLGKESSALVEDISLKVRLKGKTADGKVVTAEKYGNKGVMLRVMNSESGVQSANKKLRNQSIYTLSYDNPSKSDRAAIFDFLGSDTPIDKPGNARSTAKLEFEQYDESGKRIDGISKYTPEEASGLNAKFQELFTTGEFVRDI